MQSIRHSIMYWHVSRHISSSNSYSNLNRESRFMKKMMSGSRKNRKTKWYDNISTDLRNVNEINPINKPISVHTMRRMTIRNKLFMEHITDQMSMGEVSDIINENIEITHVKITPDFKYVNVFWVHSNNAHTLVRSEALHQCAKIIRQRLSELRVIGVVPPIQFVENKEFLMTRKVNKKLAIIDEDLKSWYEGNTDALYLNTINETSCNETERIIHDSKMDESSIQLPIMRHDVLGLDHYKIMSRVTNSLSKSKEASQRRLSDTKTDADNDSCNPQSKNISSFLTQEEQKEIFADFLIKRRIEEKHKYRMKQQYQQKWLNNYEEDTGTYYEENEVDDCDIYRNEFDEEK